MRKRKNNLNLYHEIVKIEITGSARFLTCKKKGLKLQGRLCYRPWNHVVFCSVATATVNTVKKSKHDSSWWGSLVLTPSAPLLRVKDGIIQFLVIRFIFLPDFSSRVF